MNNVIKKSETEQRARPAKSGYVYDLNKMADLQNAWDANSLCSPFVNFLRKFQERYSSCYTDGQIAEMARKRWQQMSTSHQQEYQDPLDEVEYQEYLKSASSSAKGSSCSIKNEPDSDDADSESDYHTGAFVDSGDGCRPKKKDPKCRKPKKMCARPKKACAKPKKSCAKPKPVCPKPKMVCPKPKLAFPRPSCPKPKSLGAKPSCPKPSAKPSCPAPKKRNECPKPKPKCPKPKPSCH
ncbi:histone-like protein 18C [Drosophila ficusphila]|uniref:histone-like protein 18C n=1 Tax=Drosophila ficusphila TaxID=30025 RepID=UPI0007E89F3D|nr:histone-like protein 18C [Drosophila ficusphila]